MTPGRRSVVALVATPLARLAQAPVSAREDVRRAIDAILADQDFAAPRRGLSDWIGDRVEELAEWLGELLGIPDPETSRTVLLTVLALAGLAVIAAGVVAVARRGRRPSEERDGTSSPAVDRRAAGVAELLRRAREAAALDDHLAALRLYFRALVLGLSERGDLDYRDAWTNRELLERGSPRRDAAPELARLVPRLDAQSFGRAPAGPDDVARLAAVCDRLLGRQVP